VDPVVLAISNKDGFEKSTGLPYNLVLANPQLQNSYSYIANNPLSARDKDGNCFEAVTCAVLASAVIAFFAYDINVAQAPSADVNQSLLQNASGTILDHYIPGYREQSGFTKFGAETLVFGVAGGMKNVGGNLAKEGISVSTQRAQELLQIIANNAKDLGSLRSRLLDGAKSFEVKKLVKDVFRENASIGNGGVGDAIRHEIATGQPTKGRSHTVKGRETINRINNLSRAGGFSSGDVKILNFIKNDIQDAFKK